MIPDNLARIEVTRHPMFGDFFYETYKWVGKPTDLVYLDIYFHRRHTTLPWKLKLVESSPAMRGGLYARCEHVFWFSWLYYRIKYALKQFLFGLKQKTILTLIIWGVGEADAWKELEWKDLLRKKSD